MHDAKLYFSPGDERALQHIPLREKAASAVDLIAAFPLVQQIILYGSVAKNSHGDSADIDMVVIVHDHALVDERKEIETLLEGMGFAIGNGKGQIDLNVLTADEYGHMLKSGQGRKLLEEYGEGKVLFTRDRSEQGKTPLKGIRL